jgi:hypothetical protein
MRSARAESEVIDLDALAAEIAAEAKRRRASGAFPADLERELDAAFARLAPPGAVGEDLATVLASLERASLIDVDVPTDSNRPGVAPVKKALRSGMAWYLRYVAQQVSAMGSATTRALRIVERRVDALEAVSAASPAVQSMLASLPPVVVDSGVAASVVDAVGAAAHPDDRVLVSDAGDGVVLRSLLGAGRSAYGTEPRRALHTALVRDGIDVRPDPALAHLRSLPDGSLDAVVLVDVIDTAALAVQVELIEQACRVARRTVVVATLPSVGVRAELLPGRPLSADAWTHLIESQGWFAGSQATHAFVVARPAGSSAGTSAGASIDT